MDNKMQHTGPHPTSVYDYIFLTSTLLNILTFVYGFILMLTKSMYRKKHEQTVRVVAMEVASENKMASVAHVTTKGVMNIFSSTVLVGTSVYVTVTTDVCYNPFFEHDETVALAVTLLLTMCVFNMVLTLLTEAITIRNIHEVPTYLVTSLICVNILMRGENAIAGVICLFMFGSLIADELLNMKSLTSLDETKMKKKRKSKWVHVFHLSMHILCNFLFPALLFLSSTWFSKRSLFEMGRCSIIIFFFGTTFFILSNVWRLMCACKNIVKATEEEIMETDDSKVLTDVWCANNISSTILPMLKKGVVPPTSCVYNNGLVIRNSDNYFTLEGIETDKMQKQIIYASQFEGEFEQIDVDAVF